jgi:hypothetical protein
VLFEYRCRQAQAGSDQSHFVGASFFKRSKKGQKSSAGVPLKMPVEFDQARRMALVRSGLRSGGGRCYGSASAPAQETS